MTRGRLVRALVLAAVLVTAASTAGGHRVRAGAAPAALSVMIDDFAHGSAGWTSIGRPVAHTRRERGEFVLTLAPRRAGVAAGIERPLPAGWTVSFDLRLARGARATLDLGGAGALKLRSLRGVLFAGRATRLHRTPERGGWYRVEAATKYGGAQLDGQPVRTMRRAGARLVVQVERGSLAVRALIAGPPTDRGALLLERLAWLHGRTPRGTFPVGLGADRRLHFSRGWTRGFWPGALWQAFDLSRAPLFERWALQATLANMGNERADTHDLGFMYERSSVAAYDHLCTGAHRPAVCTRLRRSALLAASSLLALARTNTRAGTIPTSSAKHLCRGCTSPNEADTIVDSVMNMPQLFWASVLTHDNRYRAVAARHVRTVARMMVRVDGSTWSSIVTDRHTGRLIRYDTHQGYRPSSTWARGQAWAVYGFAYAANALGDPKLLDTAQRTARYVIRRLPRPAVPRYDYDAPTGSPHDASAAIITAAGMLRLAAACDRLRQSCDPAPEALRTYARGLLAAGLADVRTRPPLGVIPHQVYGFGGKTRWDDDAELIFGLDFALEALRSSA